jgi:outer membrane protein assembly factor BamB
MWLSLLILACGLTDEGASRGPEQVDWPLFRGDPSLRGVASGSFPSRAELLWKAPTGAAIASSPVVADGKVFVGSDDQHLHCVALEDGAPRWVFETGDMIEAPPLVHRGSVYFGSSDFFFYALDAQTGELRWKHEVGDKILGGANWIDAPGGEESWIVVGCYDNKLYCFDTDGEVQWEYLTDNYVNGTPAVWGTEIVFGGCDAVLHVVDGHTGEAAYQVEVGDSCHIAGSAGVADGKAFFGHYGNEFVCLDWRASKIDWRYGDSRFAFFSSPAIYEGRVVFGGRDKKLHCVDQATGTPYWTYATRRKVDSSPVICGDGVVFASGDGRLYGLGLKDGEERWVFEIGSAIYSSPAVADGVVFVGCDDGHLYAVGEKHE